MKKLKKILLLVQISILLTGLFHPKVIAQDEKKNININYIFEDVQIKLFKLADINDNGQIHTLDNLTKYHIDISNYQELDKLSTAKTLASYFKRDMVVETAKAKTDSNLKASLRKLDFGIYLLMGESKKVDNYNYFITPSLVCLAPSMELNEVNIDLKYEKHAIEDNKIEYKVYKIWKDKDNPRRPKEIEVQLLKDGVIFDTRKLKDDNNWTYTWKSLEPNHTYEIVEKDVPEGYSLSINSEARVFNLINTYKKELVKENNRTIKAPQTGQLWWPLPILLLAFFVFLYLGIKANKNNEKNI